MKTKERLAKALEEAGAPQNMIELARSGHYDDFESVIATPISALVEDCRMLGLDKLAQRAMDGEFDGTKEDAEAWAGSSEGQEVIQEFMNPKEEP